MSGKTPTARTIPVPLIFWLAMLAFAGMTALTKEEFRPLLSWVATAALIGYGLYALIVNAGQKYYHLWLFLYAIAMLGYVVAFNATLVNG